MAVTAIFFAYIHTLDPFAIQFTESFGIRWYGLAYLGGFLSGYLVTKWMISRGGSPLDTKIVGDLIFTLALGTIIGGRLGYCIFYNPELFLDFGGSFPFWGVAKINEGGMASHGGIVGLIAGCIWFARRNGFPALHIADLASVGGSIGIFFGRMANFINAELVGRPAPPGYPFAVKFPQDILSWPNAQPQRLSSLSEAVSYLQISPERWQNLIDNLSIRSNWNQISNILESLISAVQGGNAPITTALESVLTPRYPSQIYAGLLEGLVVLVVLILVWMKPRKPGMVGAIFLMTYSIMRVLSEQFRMPDPHLGYQLFDLTRGQWLSIAMFALSVLTFLWIRSRNEPPIGGWIRQHERSGLS